MRKIKFLIVFIALILVFISVYQPHFNYPYPLHMDEWQHIAQAEQIVDEGGLVNKNPYFPAKEERDLESGFHIFIAQFFLLTGLDPVLDYRFLPATFAVLAALALFIFLFRITNFWVALFSILFFSTLPSNINILGLSFFVPLTLSIFFIYLFFLLFKLDNKKLLLITIFLLTLFLVHPVSGLILLPFIFFSCLLNPAIMQHLKKYIKKRKTLIISFFVLSFLIIFCFRDFIFKLIKLLVFKEGWGLVEIKYTLSSLYGKISSILAVFGAFIAFKGKLKAFILWLLFVLSLVYLFHYFGFTVLIPYQRLVYYIMIALVPLSALGLYSLLRFPFKLKINKKLIKIFSVCVACLLLFFVFYEFIKLTSPYTELYHLIDEEDYKAIKWLSNYSGSVVIAPVFVSSAIYPISKNHVVAITLAQLGLIKPIKDNELFFKGNCTIKEVITKKYNVDFVFSRKKIDCKNLKEVYSQNNYIYEII